MAPGLKIPYYADDLPSPIPTFTEISKGTVDPDTRHHPGNISHPCDDYTVKYGRTVDFMEAEIMMLVREKTNMPVPKIYAAFSHPDRKCNYIVMERIHGPKLGSLWTKLNDSEKDAIAVMLRDSFQEIRQMPSPGYFGGLDKRPFPGGVFISQDSNVKIDGPFDSEASLVEAMAERYIERGLDPHRAEYYRRCLPHILHDHTPKFTQADLHMNNIILQGWPDKDDTAADLSKVKAFVTNWGRSGWYPDCWEYCIATSLTVPEGDWCTYLDKILEPYYPEAGWMMRYYYELMQSWW